MAHTVHGFHLSRLAGTVPLMLGLLAAAPGATPLDLTGAVVVTPSDLTGPERKAVEMLVDEVFKRSSVRWQVQQAWPADAKTVIVVGSGSSLPTVAGPFADILPADGGKGAEGYRLKTVSRDGVDAVLVAGNDAHGVLYGVGRLLREMRMTRKSVQFLPGLDIDTAPRYPLRGHQLGYRPKVNTYDGWNVDMYEQYIRDLAVFGANAIELIPPRSDDDKDSPHFTLEPIEMLAEVSRLADEYGIEYWLWYPAMDRDYSDPETVEKALAEWGAVFEKLPRIDAIFVPGGDPGHTQPKYLMALLEKQTEVLHKTHPEAQMWMSPQSFTAEWMDEFIAIMQNEQPAWLTGIVFGPQNRISLSDLRKAIPAKYPIRRYPDITHSIRCQYAVPDLDLAYAMTEEREVINPRPLHYAQIFRLWKEEAIGFLTYSEGCNDDVNKTVWSALGWDPDADVVDVLRQYARYVVAPSHEEGCAQVLLALERNWHGPLLTNTGVMTTLAQVRELERTATPQIRLQWRFQQIVYRAYYDAFLRTRLLYETDLEEQAMAVLRRTDRLGAPIALDQAEALLDRAVLDPAGQDLRARVFEMAEALYQSIRMQHSVPRYQAIEAGRGGNLDLIDRPLNNRAWLKEQFAGIRAMERERDRVKAIDALVNWTNPGPGGFYDELGNPAQRPHLVRTLGPDLDPEYRVSPGTAFAFDPNYRLSWDHFAEARYDASLTMRYTGLEPQAEYTLRAVYAGDNLRAKLRLVANGTIEIHPFTQKKTPVQPVEFDIPPAATENGSLELSWCQEPGSGGAGRGCQIAEVWLLRKDR
ncbi:MAG: hypothetical protein QG656_428 [Candidatus Hydrogenedentes bacterium]|nr:hypothetical protein [Candidatus Hydrogenedentota bacterium]